MQSQVISIDAPIEGWDAFHSLDNMPPNAAILLDNLIPEPGKVRTREGYLQYSDLGVEGTVETLASLNNETSDVLVAAASGGMWRIDNVPAPTVFLPDPAPAAFVELAPEGTFQSDRWQSENFRKFDETGILVLCNGVDNTQVLREYPVGSGTWELKDLEDSEGVGTDFIGGIAFKGRMYYWKENDNAFYYAQAGAYQGTLKKFDLGTFTKQGGSLVFIGTWTQQDSGDGKDDFIFFMFSTGEILLYQGDDPETTGYWELVGRYFTAEPLSIRGYTNYGSDAIIMTKDGYIALSTIIQQGRTSDVPAFSRLIQPAIKQRTAFFSEYFGWDVKLYPKEGLMLFNVPIGQEDPDYGDTAEFVAEQHVLNTVTERWCRFNSMNVTCLEVHKERLYGGGKDGKIYALLETESDDGNPINFDCIYAFNYMGNPGVKKHLTAAEVISTHNSPEFIQLRGYADYEVPILTPVRIPVGRKQGVWSRNNDNSEALPPAATGSFWDEDYWDDQNIPYTTHGWQNVSAYGYAVSLLVRFAQQQNRVDWRSTNLRFHPGGSQ